MTDLKARLIIQGENKDALQKLQGVITAADGVRKKVVEAGQAATSAMKPATAAAKETGAAMQGAGNQAADAGNKLKQVGDRGAQGMSKLEGEIRRVRSQLAGLLGVAAFVQLTRDTIQTADAMTRLQGRISLFTGSQEETASVMARVYQISQETRSSIESTGESYARMAAVTKTLKLSQEEILGVTRSVNQALKIGGATTSEAEATIRQFSQSLAKGKLNGDELNSVLENAPRLTRVFTDAFRMDMGRLVEQARDGTITAMDLVKAIQNQTGALNSEFKKLPVTAGDAWMRLTNTIKLGLANIDMSPVIDQINELEKTMKDPAVAAGFATITAALVLIASWAAKAAAEFAGLGTGIGEFFAKALNRSAIQKLEDQIKATEDLLNGKTWFGTRYPITFFLNDDELRSQLAELRAQLEGLTGSPAATSSRPVGLGQRLGRGLGLLSPPAITPTGTPKSGGSKDSGVVSQMQSESAKIKAALELFQANLDRALEAGQSDYSKYFSSLRGEIERTFQQQIELREQTLGKLGKTSSRERVKAEIETLKAEKEKSLTDLSKKEADFNREVVTFRAELNQRRLTAEGNEYQAHLADLEQRYKDWLEKLKKAGQDTAPAEQAYAAERTRIEKDHAREVSDFKAELTQRQYEAEGKSYEAQLSALEVQYATWLERLKELGLDASLAKTVFDVEKAKLPLNQIEEAISTKELSIANRIQVIQAEREAGLRSEVNARRAILSVEKEIAQTYEQVLPNLEKIYRETGDPRILQQINAIKTKLKEFGLVADDVAVRVNDAFESGVVDNLTDFITRTKDAKTAFLDFARSMLNALARIAAQNIFESIFNSSGGGTSGIGAFFSQLIAKKAQGGEITGPGGPTDDRVPILASPGEYVIKAASVRKFGRGFMDAVNSGVLPSRRYAVGGMVAAMPTSRTSVVGDTNVSITVNTDSGESQTSGDQGRGHALANVIKGAVLNEIVNQKRPGGLLAAS